MGLAQTGTVLWSHFVSWLNSFRRSVQGRNAGRCAAWVLPGVLMAIAIARDIGNQCNEEGATGVI